MNKTNSLSAFDTSLFFSFAGFGTVLCTSSGTTGHFCRFRGTKFISHSKQSRNGGGFRRDEANHQANKSQNVSREAHAVRCCMVI